LHGVGERGWGGDDLPLVRRWGLPKLLVGNGAPALRLPFLVVAPQCPGDARWCDPPVLAALARLLDRLVEDGEADARRLACAGFSMGGIGAFCLALQAPRRFAALVSVCGACEEPERLDELAHLPQWIAWAEDDDITRLTEGSREVVKRLQKYGKLIARPYRLGALHGDGAHVRTADAAFSESDLYQWLAAVPPAD
jgi:predicted peptidase